jgi:hypothetical protein
MPEKWKGLLIVFAVVNLFALLLTSREYTAWNIRTRSKMAYFVLRRDKDRRRADEADELAEGVVRWLRPSVLVALNLFLAYLAVYRT